MMYQEDVDEWVEANDKYNAEDLLDEKLPKMRAKLNRLDKRIIELLEEIRLEFPDAQYYTASGGFNLILGSTHTSDRNVEPRQQRSAWGGHATIGDGDW